MVSGNTARWGQREGGEGGRKGRGTRGEGREDATILMIRKLHPTYCKNRGYVLQHHPTY